VLHKDGGHPKHGAEWEAPTSRRERRRRRPQERR